MKTYAYGFPKIGKQREFKKAIEGFWSGVSTETELKARLLSLEQERIRIYKKYVDLFPTGEMSLYDQMLDTAIIFGVYPTPANLNEYFDLCRGKAALELSKWFNTNYHYLVPEIERSEFKFQKEALKDRFNSKGIPYIIGPFTFLKLSKGWDRAKLPAYLEALSLAYIEFLDFLKKSGYSALHIDEPALVSDLKPAEVEAVKKAYQKLGKRGIDLYLFTYYESVDILSELYDLPIKGLGLDFVNGPENLKNLKAKGFPKDKVLFAGIVSGRNVWRTDLDKCQTILEELKKIVGEENLIISNAAPLYHLPFSLEGETLDPALLSKLAFAKERLKELAFLKKGNLEELRTWSLGLKTPFGEDKEVKEAVEKLKEEDFKRKPPYSERIKVQKAELNLPLFPTTTIGSFPQTKELREKRQAYRAQQISEAEYKNYIKEKMAELVKLQEDQGLDVLVHGEFERTDMVEFFAEKLKGMATTRDGWILSYGTRVYRPPIIYGNVKRVKPLTLDEITYAQSLSQKPVKGMLTGPITILAWSFVREDIPIEKVAFEIALALREEILTLEKAGIKIIQIDEPAFREKMPIKKSKADEYFAWATKAFRLASAKVKPSTQIHAHMCYSEFGEIISQIYKLDADVISIEASRSKGDILEAFEKFNYDHQIGLGVWDIHSPRIPEVEDMKKVVERSLKVIPKENFWINPDCGLKTRNWEEVIPSLKNMVALAKGLRKLCVTIALLCVTACGASASPILSEETAILAKGRIGIFPLLSYTIYNTEYDAFGNPTALSRSSTDAFLYTELFYGLTDQLTLRFAAPLDSWQDQTLGSESGLYDMDVKAMYKFKDETDKYPAFTGLIGLKLPTGDYNKGLSTGSYDLTMMLIFDKSSGPWKGYLNLAHVYTSEFITPDGKIKNPGDKFQVNLALDYKLTDNLLLASDLMAELVNTTIEEGSAVENSSGLTISLVPGINYLFTPNNILYAGVQAPLLVKRSYPSMTGITLIGGIYNEF